MTVPSYMTAGCYDPRMLSDPHDFGVEDRNGDGFMDAIRARIYVADDASPDELAAAANLAARLAFESTSMDLPIGLKVSAVNPDEGTPVLVGRAATQARTGMIALSDIGECERLACSLGLDTYAPSGYGTSRPLRSHQDFALRNPFESARNLLLGPNVRSVSVIDLAARIALESTELRLPLVRVLPDRPDAILPENTILVGHSNPHVLRLIREGKFRPPVEAGTGFIAAVERCIVIAGADAKGEEAAIRHAALRMPYLWEYAKGQASVRSIEDEVRVYCPYDKPEPELVLDETCSFPWEVDDARQRILDVLTPRVKAGAAVTLDLRLSESVEVRRQLSDEILAILTRAGVALDRSSIRVLSAHKQGFYWIDEQLKPSLKAATRVRIRYRELKPGPDSVDTANRWLHELYPIDEILARDLGIPIEQILFEQVPSSAKHVYEVIGENHDGAVVVQSTLDPCFVTRPLFDMFPNYANATVATGWILASVHGSVVLDERIKTDYERFWDWYQQGVLPRVQDYVLNLHDGHPQPDKAPHFEVLNVELQLSEPDHRLEVDEERISTLEALHEDIYFETLLFFDLLGIQACQKPLRYPGRIIPRVLPARKGPGFAHVRLTGYRTPFPNHRPFASEDPTVTALMVSESGVTGVELEAGARFCWRLRRGTREEDTPANPSNFEGVQWEEPIGPDECERLVGQLAHFPEVRRFAAGRSWLGRTIWAMDVTSPARGKYFSQPKAIATKPCLFVTGRQHANEVSSTSHILRFVELLVTDPQYGKLLDRVNFIVQPMTNPDGAALVEELHKVTPEFMLHAGYLGALGVDVTEEQWTNAPKYPEARVRADLWRMWQPDIVLNPHGYPSHEWVQLFAGYTAWLKSKRAQARDWWIPRGWFIPRFDFIEDERFPRHRAAALELRDQIAAAVRRVFGPVNERMYRRYARYTGCTLDLHQGVLIQSPSCGSKPDSAAFGFMIRHPEVTFIEGLSEAPDEVASGEWLEKLATVGLEVTLVFARYLAELPNGVVRTRWKEGTDQILHITRRRLVRSEISNSEAQ